METKMASIVIFILGMFITPAVSITVKMCASLDSLTGVEQGQKLPDSEFITLTMPGIMTCSRACLARRRCKSFNFNTKTGECQLNSRAKTTTSQLETVNDFVFSDISHWPERLLGVCANHTCPSNSFCQPVDKTNHVCNITGCLGVPVVENGQFQIEPEETMFGHTLIFSCNPGYIKQGEAVCQDNATWSHPVCVSVSNCNMVKQVSPDSDDGEYWLRLTSFDNYTTQIYCHNMSTSSPVEFLTLPIQNRGYYPSIKDEDCDGTSAVLNGGCAGQGGQIWFQKIRVNITNMKVSRSDRTFTYDTVKHYKMEYGSAFDCFTPHPDNQLRCGTRGIFTINLHGTGWRVKEGQEWHAFGYQPFMEDIDWQLNGTKISMKCGGFGGGCRPTGDLFLAPWIDSP